MLKRHKSITLYGHLPQPPPPTPVPAPPSLNSCPPRWSGIPIAPAHFFSTLNTVSSVGVQLRESVLPQNTKMWCSISAKNISAFINVDSTAILFIFWNWKTWYNLQRRIEKYLQQKHLPELHNGAQWIGKNQWFLYDITDYGHTMAKSPCDTNSSPNPK